MVQKSKNKKIIREIIDEESNPLIHFTKITSYSKYLKLLQLNKKINLGLDIGSSDILAEFSDEMKSKNFVFSVGVDFLKNYFSIKKC